MAFMTYAAFPTDGGFWEWVVYLIMEYKEVFLRGAFWTLAIAVVGTIIGCIIGFIVGIIQTIELEANCNYAKRAAIGLLKAVTRLYVEIFRGTPMIVQAMVIYYGLAYLRRDLMYHMGPALLHHFLSGSLSKCGWEPEFWADGPDLGWRTGHLRRDHCRYFGSTGLL